MNTKYSKFKGIENLVKEVYKATEYAKVEASLRHVIEKELEKVCEINEIAWNPYTFERSLQGKSGKKDLHLDAIHGEIVIEYEPPKSFNRSDNQQFKHAKKQAEDYTERIAIEEGRSIEKYTMIVWDGETISFGRWINGLPYWEIPAAFDRNQANRIVGLLNVGSKPLVSPYLLQLKVGPQSDIGSKILSTLYELIHRSTSQKLSNRTNLIFSEWSRVFAQSVDLPSRKFKEHLIDISMKDGKDYLSNPTEYLFALNTYIAMVAKIVAAYSLMVVNTKDSISGMYSAFDKMSKIESPDLYYSLGIDNMLSGDFFSWYGEEKYRVDLEELLKELFNEIELIDFDAEKKSFNSKRDLFKGMYMEFTPKELRHALGEYYTPDWLAQYVIDRSGWKTNESMLDPTCGSGTFVLECLKRRIGLYVEDEGGISDLLEGLYGFDLNPIAVLMARSSLVVALAEWFDPESRVSLPIYLADAINHAEQDGNSYVHTLLTAKGNITIRVPKKMVDSIDYYQIMSAIRDYISYSVPSESSDYILDRILSSLNAEFSVISSLKDSEIEDIRSTISMLLFLHRNDWDGIWALIIADRIAAGNINKVDHIIGNPPWVKWTHLPSLYAEFIKDICIQYGIFSNATYVGGIESDICTVVTYSVIGKYLRDGGRLSFLMTQSVFSSESSQGFRRWILKNSENDDLTYLQVQAVEDFSNIKPFDGVNNQTALLVLDKNNLPTEYPVKYRVWQKGARSQYVSKDKFLEDSSFDDLYACPVFETDSGPWLVGSQKQLANWEKVFSYRCDSPYIARKGVTTDLNGLYFVRVQKSGNEEYVWIENDPSNGRKEIEKSRNLVESRFIYPLIRGKDLSRYQSSIPLDQAVILPQDGMFGDQDLMINSPKLYRYLAKYEDMLKNRSSYRRYQKGHPFWSVWSTGPYTFSKYKVIWKEIAGKFSATYISSVQDHVFSGKVIVPDHKVYFVPVGIEEEAAYLVGVLNSHVVSSGITAYAAKLSLGTSPMKYINIPAFDEKNAVHVRIADLVKGIVVGSTKEDQVQDRLDVLVLSLFD